VAWQESDFLPRTEERKDEDVNADACSWCFGSFDCAWVRQF